MVTLKQIQERIKQARESKKMKPKDLGELMGVSARTISRYEDGTRGIDLGVLLQIAEILQIDPASLLSDSGYKEKQSAIPDILSQEEKRLVTIYNNLNGDGRKHLMDCAENASEVSRYKKSVTTEEAIA